MYRMKTNRWICVQLLLPSGSTEWRVIPWGKQSLDTIRKDGYILFHYELQ